MPDIQVNYSEARKVRVGATPVSLPTLPTEVTPPVEPIDSNYVPYSGATENVELGEYGVGTGFVKFDTTPTATPATQGTMYWDADDETVALVMNGTILKIGEDQYYPVKNQTGSLIAKGTAVRFAGTVGSSGRLLIAPFIGNGTVPSVQFMGVCSEDIADGADGKVLWFGRLRGINTNAYNEGDILYASTTVSGGFQTAVPVLPNNVITVCAVITKSINNGEIFVRPTINQSLWTETASGIYRNGRVLIGSTSFYSSTVQQEVNGDFGLKKALLSNQENLDVDSIAPEVVATASATLYTGVFFDYVVKNGVNLRAGTITVAHDGTNVVFNEASTADLGDTAGVTFDVDINTGNIRLLATVATDNWIIKTIVRGV